MRRRLNFQFHSRSILVPLQRLLFFALIVCELSLDSHARPNAIPRDCVKGVPFGFRHQLDGGNWPLDRNGASGFGERLEGRVHCFGQRKSTQDRTVAGHAQGRPGVTHERAEARAAARHATLGSCKLIHFAAREFRRPDQVDESRRLLNVPLFLLFFALARREAITFRKSEQRSNTGRDAARIQEKPRGYSKPQFSREVHTAIS